MYCSNCGKEMVPGAAMCVSCGFAKGTGKNYCENCGMQVNPNAAVCTSCGCSLNHVSGEQSTKSKMVAGLLYILLGALGVGDFYLGYTSHGAIKLVVSLLTAGIGGIAMWIWSIIDGIKVFQGEKPDAKGLALKD